LTFLLVVTTDAMVRARAGVATGSAEYEEVLGCLASLITQKVRADTGNRGDKWALMAKHVQVGGGADGFFDLVVAADSDCWLLLILILIGLWLRCQILELEEPMTQLKVVHVAGTKGKVSAPCIVSVLG
jgi:folylpolyglutamate synthase